MTGRNYWLVGAGVFVISMAAIFAAAAQDHLLPEESHFTDPYWEQYHALYAKRLGRMRGLDAFANVVVFPSFSREYTIVLEEKDGDHQIVCMQTKQQIADYQLLEMMKAGAWNVTENGVSITDQRIAELEAALPDDLMDVEAVVQEIDIDETLGRALYSVWGEMLYATRYPVPVEITPESYASFGPGEDGTMFHFSFFHRRTPLSGRIWSPRTDSKPGRLVAIVEAMKEACDSGDAASISKLSAQVDDLAAAIADSKETP